MLSTLELTYDLEEGTKAVVLEKVTNPKSGDKIKVYIPKIMRNVYFGEPDITICPTQYRGSFVNSPECTPEISELFKEQNYLEGVYQYNSNSKSIVEVVYNPETADINKTFIPEETEIRCSFFNGKLNQLRLNTDDNTIYESNEYVYDQYVLRSGLSEFSGDYEDAGYEPEEEKKTQAPTRKSVFKTNTLDQWSTPMKTYTKSQVLNEISNNVKKTSSWNKIGIQTQIGLLGR